MGGRIEWPEARDDDRLEGQDPAGPSGRWRRGGYQGDTGDLADGPGQLGGKGDDCRNLEGLSDPQRRRCPRRDRVRGRVCSGRSPGCRGARAVRIKLDENLPHQPVPLLTGLGHDVDTVPDEQIAGRDDSVVWAAAQAAGRFLVTQDLDFSDARKYAPGTHHGLLLVRLPQPGRSALFERIATLFRTEPVNDWIGCVVSATPRKVRVRGPA